MHAWEPLLQASWLYLLFSLEFDPQDFIFILTTLKNIIDSRKLRKENRDLHVDGGLLELPSPLIGERKRSPPLPQIM